MRRLAVLALALAFSAAAGAAQAPVRVLTFNIRYGTAPDGDHAWTNRRPLVIATVRDHAPHLLGVQEALKFQLDELVAALPQYLVIGVGRDDGRTAGEFSALLVDTTRFTATGHGEFWFSDTPERPGSMTWGNRYPRLCTWALLEDRATGDTVVVANQHWDHESQPSRAKAAELLLARLEALGAGRRPAIVMGDFNSGEANPAFRRLLAMPSLALRDSYRVQHPDARVVGTFNGFKGDSTGEKIDAILTSAQWQVVDASIDRRRFGTRWASDHFAVAAVVRLRP